MLQLWSVLVFLSYFSLCVGWGSIYCFITNQKNSSVIYALSSGFIIVSIIGAWINLFSIAIPIVLYSLLILGFFSTLFFFRKLIFSFQFAKKVSLVAFPSIIYLYCLFPVEYMNPHDDLVTYITRSKRMLQLGTLAHQPYEFLGLSDLGVQSFFQAFTLLKLPVSYTGMFDASFCFIAVLIYLFYFSQKEQLPKWQSLLLLTSFIFIPTQTVNMSAVYSIVLLIVLTYFFYSTKSWWLLGMNIGLLVAFKSTALFFALPLFLLLKAPKKKLLAGAALSFIPWLILHREKYYFPQWNLFYKDSFDPYLTININILDAFRNQANIYGSQRIHFFPLLILLFLLSVFYKKNRDAGIYAISTLCLYLGVNATTNHEAALRYSCAFFAGVTPLIFLYALKNRSYIRYLFPLALFPFLTLAPLRITNLFHHHLLSIPYNESDIIKQSLLLYENKTEGIQQRIPKNSKIWALSITPFQFDFSRNPIFYYHYDWEVAPWRIKFSDTRSFLRELSHKKINYIYWDYDGPGVRKLNYFISNLQYPLWKEYRALFENAFRILTILETLRNTYPVLFDDGRTIILKVPDFPPD